MESIREQRTITFGVLSSDLLLSTTEVACSVLGERGYTTVIQTLSSLEHFLESLRKGQIDVFLGLWLPLMDEVVRPYLSAGDVAIVGINMQYTAFSLGVPHYLWLRGLREFRDITKFTAELGCTISSFAEGSPGTPIIQRMIDQNAHGLGDAGFRVDERSEDDFMSYLCDALSKSKDVIFLSLYPNKLHAKFDIRHPGGGTLFGEASIHTLSRRDFDSQLPNAARFLSNFSLRRREVMAVLMEEVRDGAHTANTLDRLRRAHERDLNKWLDGVMFLF